MGYGARALESLNSFYSGDLLNLDEVMEEDSVETFAEAATKIDKVSWQHVTIRFELVLTLHVIS
jgi:N-acetyltransferase 10